MNQRVTHCFTRDSVVDKGQFMWFLGVGLVVLFLKFQEIGPVASWPWWGVLLPFGLAAVWWTWADHSGYTKRKAVERENVRKQARLDRQRDALGLTPKRRK